MCTIAYTLTPLALLSYEGTASGECLGHVSQGGQPVATYVTMK